MVVHGDDFDWLSQQLNEKLESVQRDSGPTWEVDLRHAELAAAELGLQAARPQTSQGGAKASTPLESNEPEPDGQKAITTCQRDWHNWQQTDPSSHSPARNAAVQLGKQPVLTSHF